MTFRVEFNYRVTIPNVWEQGGCHRDIEAEGPAEAIDKLMNLETHRGKLKDCCKVWGVDVWEKKERPKEGWVEADDPQRF